MSDKGGSVPLRGCSLPGNVGFLEVLEASDPSLSVDCLPVRSAVTHHVDSDVLLKTAPKNHVRRQGGGRHQDGRWEMGAPAAGGENDRECTRTSM